jgi:hypothetical protein
MKFFSQLGKQVDDLWRRRNYDERLFPLVATQALAEYPPGDYVSPYDVVRWALREREGYPPINEEAFGEPPVVVFRGRRFYIEVLFWVDGATSIHEHAFSGAFHVLDGSSIHTQFSFALQRRINTRIRLGRLETTKLEYLRQGDTRPIKQGESFIHSLFHLDRPSVSVVIRTRREGSAPQYSYLRPGLSYDRFFRDEQLEKQLRFLTMLLHTQPKRALEAVRDILRYTDYYGAWKVAEIAYYAFEEGKRRSAFVALLQEKHGALADPIVAAMNEIGHRRRMIELRKTITNADHRFFLALLLNLSSRTEMFQMIATRYPKRDPRQVIMRWMEEITSYDGKAPLPVPFGSGTLEVFCGLLEGKEPRSVAKAIANSAATPAEAERLRVTVVDLCQIFAKSMFRDLLFAA